ncbi:MAG: protoporphyrinogen oxidase [Chloroflexi bacterium]|nr:protoporphyrinogen oxidase [Ardenticatenaceae bacterium]MBL1130115.1 protoporphyrinogen oxidase [Chloroflexota bacterium]NOG36202.1 protoporphyrinogen oxidase [Chloroflexota bacterium]GIK56256.1 MAG: protoporphyrinogen oxidase [Chloroflexota bacterium]
MNPNHVTIVGGGITGLSAAWYVQQEAARRRVDITYTLLEQSDRWGGKILTETVAGYGARPFIIEAGPDSFLSQKPWAAQLARELGIADQFLPTNDGRRQTFILHNSRPTPLPDGVMLIAPTKIKPFLQSRLISPWGKLRMGLDWFIPPKTDDDDETLAQFIQRRLGQEALDKIAEPLLSGIYNADAELQSIMATFPRFRAMEKEHGSLIKAMLAAKKSRAQASPNGDAPGMFTSFKPGMEELTQALREQLTGDCRLGIKAERLEIRDWRLTGDLQSPIYQLHLSDGSTLLTNTIILAVPSFISASLLADIAPQAAETLRQIRYVSTGTVSLAYKRDEIDHPLNGFGIVIPRSERRRINAVTWSSTKFEHRAPEGFALLRVFFGGSRTPEMMDVADDALLPIAQAELQQMMGITAVPLFHRIYRWQNSNPQYDVGHLERVAAIEASLPPGIFVTGSPYRGVGIPDCVKQAKDTAVQAVSNWVIA